MSLVDTGGVQLEEVGCHSALTLVLGSQISNEGVTEETDPMKNTPYHSIFDS